MDTKPPSEPTAIAPWQFPSPDDRTEASVASLEVMVAGPWARTAPLPPWIDAREPITNDHASTDLVVLHAPHSLAAQQFRALRYQVEQEPDIQIVTVISPRVEEGKSVTAANLALALAEGGRVKVLLIDAALCSPDQAILFGLKPGPGLTSAIAERSRYSSRPVSVVQVTQGLFVLPAGPRAVRPHAVLASEPAADLMGSLRRAFRYIIVDSSPIFGSAETLAWHGMIDRYILVARRGSTTTEDLSKSVNRLGRDKVLGVTLAGVRLKSLVG